MQHANPAGAYRLVRSDMPEVNHSDARRESPFAARPADQSRAGLRVFAAVLVVSAIAASISAVALHHAPPLSSPALLRGSATHAVIILIDGALPSQLNSLSLPNIGKLVAGGVVYNDAWIGQVEASADASAATIGTGQYPRGTGIIGPVWTDAQTGQPSTASSPASILTGSFDEMMQARAIPSLAGDVKAGVHQASILAVGGADCAVAAAGTWRADYIACPARDGTRWSPASVAGHPALPPALRSSAWSLPIATGNRLGATVDGWSLGSEDTWISRYAVAAMHLTRPVLTIVDYPEIRQVEPYSGIGGRGVVNRLLRGIDRGVGAIVGELRREHAYNRTVFVVTSGTGDSPFSDAVSRGALSSAVQAAGGQEVYATTGAAAFLGLTDPLQAQPVAQAIGAANLAAIDAIFYKSRHGSGWTYANTYLNPQLPSNFTNATSYLLGTLASASSPDIVVAYAPHTGTEQHAGAFTASGSTDGLQWDTQHIPLIIAGDGVYAHGSSDYPARLVDIAPTVEALLNLPPRRNEGVVLADAMQSPPAASVDRQKATGHALAAAVAPLQKRLASAGG